MRWKTLLIFFFLLVEYVATEKAEIQQNITTDGTTFSCNFNIDYKDYIVNVKKSSLSCTPRKPKIRKPVDIEIETPDGFKFIGSIKINPSKIVSMYLEPPFDTLNEMFQGELDKISTEERFEHRPGCGLETKEFEAQKRGYTLKTVTRWEGAKIDWSFVSNGDDFAQYGFMTDARIGLSKSDVWIVMKAMKQIEEVTCIRFQFQKPQKGKEWLAITRETTSGTNQCQAAYIRYTYHGKDVANLGNVFWGQFSGCFGGAYAYLGSHPSHLPNQNQLFVISAVTLSDDQRSVGLVVHELLHNLGVGHTQKRPDQKQNIQVLWQNIQNMASAKYQYSMCEGDTCLTYGTKYDCTSIMHYEDWAFSSNGQPTMLPKYPSRCNLKTAKIRLTETDITLLKKMYCDDKPAEQVIKSPNHPENYPDNQDITTPIDAGSGNVVEITFTDFDIESHSSCGYDYVKIIDADGTVLLRDTCGNAIDIDIDTDIGKITSRTQKVDVIFHSDGSENGKGFRAEWKAIKKSQPIDGHWSGWTAWSPCSNGQDGKSACMKKQTRYCNNPAASNGGLACQGDGEKTQECSSYDLSDATKHKDCVLTGGWTDWGGASTCNSECKTTKTRTCNNPTPINSKPCDGTDSETETCTGGECASSESGAVTSPNYPENYPDSQDVTKILQVAEDSKIELKFTSFVLEHQENCGYDYVEVLDTDGTSIAKKCGSIIPDTIVSTGNKLTVHFHSDYSENYQGFSADWKKVDATSSGLIKSPNYPENYPDKALETYTLTVDSGKVELTFTDFDIEPEDNCGYDYVEVFDTDETTSLKKACGTSKPSPVTSTGNKMIVKFVSDYYITKKGFSATWKKVE